jgi:hypothetical protein
MLAARRLQIPHRTLHIGVAEPLLNRAQIDASPERPPCKSRSELVQPEVLFVELRALSNRFQTVEKIELRLAASGWEDQTASLF